jgi:predicted nucleic acid-binding protein
MLLVDTNVLIDIWEDDPQWADWSIAQLRAQSQLHMLAINSIVYAELTHAFHRYEDLDAAVLQLDLTVLETPRPALFLAGKAFARYKQNGGTRTNVLPDFLIGAHAAVLGCALITRDARRYAKYFPTVSLITP